jgi:hypothetical protein
MVRTRGCEEILVSFFLLQASPESNYEWDGGLPPVRASGNAYFVGGRVAGTVDTRRLVYDSKKPN